MNADTGDSPGNEPWRYACPRGHRGYRNRVNGGYYCPACERRYDGKPVDLKQK